MARSNFVLYLAPMSGEILNVLRVVRLARLYWAISSITSTGYGDMVPITAAGRVVGFFTMLLSIAVVAIPSGIFTAGFVAEFQKRKGVSARGGGAQDRDARDE